MRIRIKRATVSAAGSLLFICAVANAAAQAPADASGGSDAQTTAPKGKQRRKDELSEIVVTGIRASVEAAISVKKLSNEIVEAVSAEDIGKLPDTSIAESISRLPGVTTQRSDGRSSDISIRGFGPDFNGTLMNGREQVSTGDNRSIQFDQYPAELIQQVVVYKTPDASLVGQGLAGTIDLQTTRPLEYGHRTMVFDIRGIENSNKNLGADSTNKQYRASFSYVDQFLDHTLGVTFGFARLDTPVDTQEVGLYDPWHANTQAADSYNYHTSVPNGVYVTNGIKSLASMGVDKRDGSLATIEWKPNDSYTSTLDLYYTSRTFENNRRSMEANLGNYPQTTNYSNLDIVNNTLIGATVANLVPLARNFLYITKDQILATGWHNKWNTGEWNWDTDLAYSRAVRDEHDYETQATYQGVTDTGSFLLPSSSGPTFQLNSSYSDPSKVLVGPTIYGAGYSRFPHVVDELKSARIDVSHPAGMWFSTVAAGVNYDDRSKDKRQPEGGLNAIPSCPCQIASQYLLPPTNLGFSGTPSSLSWNVPAVLANYFQPIQTSTTANYLVGKSWQVHEKLTTVYVKGNLDHDLSDSVTLRGNVGLQVVHTDQSSSSQYFDEAAGIPRPITGGKTYNDVLPAVNLVFGLPAQQDVRVGIAREIARPRMDQMDASFDFSAANTAPFIPSANGGNPRLDPWRADAFDLSYEKYFQNRAYVSAAAFYKKLKTYIYQINAPFDFSSFNALLPPGYLPSGAAEQALGTYTAPANGNGGRVDGIELAVSLPGEMISDYLTGFGANASVSETDSSISIPGQVASISSQAITLPGLSKTVWQATVYYERYGFSARLATRYRSNYIGEITDFAGDRALEYVRHEQITDFQTGYDFTKGRLSGLSLLFQIDNMTNTPFIDYAGVGTRVRDYETYGRLFFLGAKYKL
ncbi:MAG: TonB-dependent receptor [Gammaproteobacteria bacterium]|nr:TonB-dependent receptor [Gammaproteobacteria bacterium]